MMGGSQKCRGAAPIFRISAVIMRLSVRAGERGVSTILPIRREDLNAWMRKYFRAACVEKEFFLSQMRGINDRVLISRPNQLIYQEVEEAVIIVPITRVSEKRREEGRRRIRKWQTPVSL